jgi:hypothetical protein
MFGAFCSPSIVRDNGGLCYHCDRYGHKQASYTSQISCAICCKGHRRGDCPNKDSPKCPASVMPGERVVMPSETWANCSVLTLTAQYLRSPFCVQLCMLTCKITPSRTHCGPWFGAQCSRVTCCCTSLELLEWKLHCYSICTWRPC